MCRATPPPPCTRGPCTPARQRGHGKCRRLHGCGFAPLHHQTTAGNGGRHSGQQHAAAAAAKGASTHGKEETLRSYAGVPAAKVLAPLAPGRLPAPMPARCPLAGVVSSLRSDFSIGLTPLYHGLPHITLGPSRSLICAFSDFSSHPKLFPHTPPADPATPPSDDPTHFAVMGSLPPSPPPATRRIACRSTRTRNARPPLSSSPPPLPK